MMRRILAIVVGLCACGDSNHLKPDAAIDAATDAAIDARPPNPDAAPVDASPDAFVDTSVMLRYDFEDTTTTVTDSSSRGKNGTLNDVAAWTADGRNSRGLALIGGSPATRFVTLPDGVLTGVNDFTISAWVKPNTIANWMRIYDIGNGMPGTRWMFLTLHGFTGPAGSVVDDGVHASSFGGDPTHEIISASSTQLPVGVWKHVAVTGSGGVRTLYIDGYPAATATTTLAVPPSDMEPIGGNSWIGKSRFPDPGLDGTLDDFRIYNRVLAQGEIADLAWPKHDYSYWRFDETTGQTAKDSSDNAVPTALMSSPTWVAGRLGGALDFPGGAAGPNGPHAVLASTPLASCTTQLTVATWVKLHSQDAWARIFDFGTGTTSFIFLTLFDDRGGQHGMHFAMVSPGGVFDMFTATPPIAGDDTWHHVAVTVTDAGLVTMYVDGTSVMTPQTNTTGSKVSDFTATTENYLGKSRFPDPYLHAALDDLRISCRAFTADEIKNLSRP